MWELFERPFVRKLSIGAGIKSFTGRCPSCVCERKFCLCARYLSHVATRVVFGAALTDVVVALSLAELLAQRERREALELFRELLGRVGGEGPGALPAQLIERVRLAHLVVLQVHHVEHVALGLLGRDLAALVVRADDVQVVVDAHVHRVLVAYEALDRERGKKLL